MRGKSRGSLTASSVHHREGVSPCTPCGSGTVLSAEVRTYTQSQRERDWGERGRRRYLVQNSLLPRVSLPQHFELPLQMSIVPAMMYSTITQT